MDSLEPVKAYTDNKSIKNTPHISHDGEKTLEEKGSGWEIAEGMGVGKHMLGGYFQIARKLCNSADPNLP